MANSSQQSDEIFGTYTHRLTVDELPAMSHNIPKSNYFVNSKMSNSIIVSNNSPAGYLCLTPEFKISVNKKPHPKHLHNMKKAFGWTWENV